MGKTDVELRHADVDERGSRQETRIFGVTKDV